ncbi:5-oxoprolinase subunit PxpA [bacterium]|nr:5-oxoprolinase subunit PxpA [bacterium]
MNHLPLNCDLGEGCGNDAALMPLIDQASIACGGHAGDAQSMSACAALAVKQGVQLGAHPAYPDRDGFGRRSLDIAPEALAASLREQVQRLADIANAAGIRLTYIKPHGALYHDLWTRPAVCEVVMRLAAYIELPVVVQAGRGDLPTTSNGVPLWREAFADRAYAADGSLQPRSQPGAVLDARAAAKQVEHLLKFGAVITADGARRPLEADTLCLHGDHPQALAVAQAVRRVMPKP